MWHKDQAYFPIENVFETINALPLVIMINRIDEVVFRMVDMR